MAGNSITLPPLPAGATLTSLPPGYVLDQAPPTANAAPAKLPPLPAGATLDSLPPPPEAGVLTNGGSALPPGYVLDSAQAGGNPPAPAGQPGLLTRLAGIGARGMVGGVDGIVNTAQAAGRWADNHLGNSDLLDRIDQRIDNAPVSQRLDGALAAAQPYAPQQASGKILQGAVSGLTGAALTGGLGAIPMATAAAVGAAVPTAKAAGASDTTADDIGMGLSLLPVAGATAAAVRSGAGNVARDALSAVNARGMTPDQATQSVLLADAIKQYQAAAPAPMDAFQAASSYKKDLNSLLGAYRPLAARAGYIDSVGSSDLGTATQQANSHTSGLSGVPGSSLDGVQTLNLPGYHQDAVQNGLAQLDTVSGQQFRGNSAGPLTTAGRAIGGAVSVVPFLDRFGMKAVGPVLATAGRVGDRLLGTQMTPAEAQQAAAQRIVQRAGIDPSQDTVGDLRGAISDAQGDIQDQQVNAQNDADAAALSAQADAAWKQNATQQADTNSTWTKALAQRDKQNQAGQPDRLSSALWRDAEQQTSPNLALVTASQSRGFQADQATLAQQAAQQQSAQAAAEARGRNLADQAGNWMERQQVAGFKRAVPGVPVTGAGMVGARTPEQLFDATGGSHGSPAGQTAPGVDGVTAGPAAAPPAAPPGSPVGVSTGASAGQPVGLPQGQPVGPLASLQATPAGMSMPSPAAPFLGSLPTGGGALAQQIFRDYHPTQPLPSAGELHGAVDDLAADGLIAPQLADHLHAGGVAPNRHVAANIADRVATGRGLPSILDPQVSALNDAQASFLPTMQGQAQQDVQAAIGGASEASLTVPNGATNGRPPITNLPRYQAAIGSYQRHAQQMMQLAPTAEKQAISQVAATSSAVGKQAIRDTYLADNPGADASRFTPQLMKGV